MEVGPQNHNKDGLLGAYFIIVVYIYIYIHIYIYILFIYLFIYLFMDPLGNNSSIVGPKPLILLIQAPTCPKFQPLRLRVKALGPI